MADESWREIESGWDDADEALEEAPPDFDDKTPIQLAESDPAPSFEEEGDTVFDGDQPTVDYLEEEVPEHVAEFLGERAPEVIVQPPAAEEAPPSSVAEAPEEEPRPSVATGEAAPVQAQTGLQPASLTLLLLALGVVIAVAAVVYAAFL